MSFSIWHVAVLLVLLIVLGPGIWWAVRSAAANPKQGVGGWLAWLIYMLYVTAPLVTLGSWGSSIAKAESDYPVLRNATEWVTYRSLSFGLVALLIAASIYIGRVLHTRKTRRTLSLARIYLCVIPFSTLVDSALAKFALDDWAAAEAGSAFVKSAIGCGVWLAYLGFSKRVRATYTETATAASDSTVHAPDSRRTTVPASSQPVQFVESSRSMGASTVDSASEAFDERKAYARVAAELGGDGRDEGLWVKCLVEGASADRQKILYAQARVAALRRQHDTDALERADVARQLAHQAAKQQAWAANLQALDRQFLGSAKQVCTNCERLLPTRDLPACPRCDAVLQGSTTFKAEEVSDARALALTKTALRRKQVDRLEVLMLTHGSAIDPAILELRDPDGNTLLHLCARLELSDEAAMLLAAGANRNAVNREEKRAYELAESDSLRTMLKPLPADVVDLVRRFEAGDPLPESELISLIRGVGKYGLDPHLRSRDGRLLMQHARDLGYTDLVATLTRAASLRAIGSAHTSTEASAGASHVDTTTASSVANAPAVRASINGHPVRSVQPASPFDERAAFGEIAKEITEATYDAGVWLHAALKAQGQGSTQEVEYAKVRLAEMRARFEADQTAAQAREQQWGADVYPLLLQFEGGGSLSHADLTKLVQAAIARDCVNLVSPVTGDTLLHVAAGSGFTDLLQLLHGQKADVGARNNAGQTAKESALANDQHVAAMYLPW